MIYRGEKVEGYSNYLIGVVINAGIQTKIASKWTSTSNLNKKQMRDSNNITEELYRPGIFAIIVI